MEWPQDPLNGFLGRLVNLTGELFGKFINTIDFQLMTVSFFTCLLYDENEEHIGLKYTLGRTDGHLNKVWLVQKNQSQALREPSYQLDVAMATNTPDTESVIGS